MKNFSFFNKLILFFVCSLAFIGLFGSFDVYAQDSYQYYTSYGIQYTDRYNRTFDEGFNIYSNDYFLTYINDDGNYTNYTSCFLVPSSGSLDYSGVYYSRYKLPDSSDWAYSSYQEYLNFNSYTNIVTIDNISYNLYITSFNAYNPRNPFFESNGNYAISTTYSYSNDLMIDLFKYAYFGSDYLPDGVDFFGVQSSDSNDSSLDLKDLSGMIQSPYKINDYHSQFSNILSDLFGRLDLGFTQNPNYYITPNIQMSWSSPDFYDSDNGFISRDYVHFKIWYSGTFSYYQELFSTITDLPSFSRSYEKLLVYDGSADQQFNHFFNTYRADISSTLDSSFYDMSYGNIEINDLGDALVQMTSIGRNPLDVLSYRIKNDVNYIYIQAYYIDSDDVMHKGAVSYLELTDNGLIVHSGVTDTDDDSSSDIDSGDFDQVVSGNGVDIDNDIKMVSGNEPDQVTDEPNIINNNNNYYTYNYYYDYTDSEQNSNFLEIFWKMVSAMTNMVGKLSSYLRYCFTGSFT